MLNDGDWTVGLFGGGGCRDDPGSGEWDGMVCFMGVSHRGGGSGRSGVTDNVEELLTRSSEPENTNFVLQITKSN